MRAAPRFARRLLVFLAIIALGAPLAPVRLSAAQSNGLPDMRWVSPTWGAIIRWHSNEWTVALDESVQGTDTLTLTDSLGNWITFVGQRAFGGDAPACLDHMVQSARQAPGVVDFRLALDETGAPYEWREPEQAYSVFQVRVPAADGALEDFVAYAECQTLVPGEAVFQRSYSGPPAVFEQWYDDIARTLEGVFLPATAWAPPDPGDPAYLWGGSAPLLTQSRINAAFVLDALEQPQVLVALETEAGPTRVVTFENVSDEPVQVEPDQVRLTLISITGEVADQVWPLVNLRWEDGVATEGDGSRMLAPGARATALLDFETGDLAGISCDVVPILALDYLPSAGTVAEFAVSVLPEELQDCLGSNVLIVGGGRPVLQPAPPAGVARETLIDAATGQLDDLGRIPLALLTIDPGATTDDPLIGPLAAVVESGSVELLLGETVITLPTGELLTAETGSSIILRNSSGEPAELLVLPLAARADWGAPVEQDPPTGVSVELLLPEQDLLNSLASRQFTIERVVLDPGATLDPRPADDGSAPAVTVLLVERGTIVVHAPSDSASEPMRFTAGETVRVPADAVVEATEDQPAEILVVHGT